MTTIASQIRSEKEGSEDRLNPDRQEVEHIPPGSSPEDAFPSIAENLEELTNELGDDQEPLLEKEVEIGADDSEVVENPQLEQIIGEEHDQQLFTDPNAIVITQEDIYDAGFTVDQLDHLTDEQISILIGISEQRVAKQNEQVIGEEVIEETHHHASINAHDLVQDENSVAIILTDDGGLKITDHTHQEFYFSPSQLEEINVNVNHLTEENVQQLVQMAMPSISVKNQHHEVESQKSVESNEYSPEEAPSTSYHSQNQQEKEECTTLIGRTVHIRTPDGRLQEAIVRYIRGNSEYKIQFMDGEFAYATIDQLILPPESSSARYAPASHLLRRQAQLRIGSMKRPSNTVSNNMHDDDEMCPPVLKRSYQLAPVVGSTHMQHAPNFCCPICDKKVYQKEPSYIVIRLPACDSCTREKIIVLDEQTT